MIALLKRTGQRYKKNETEKRQKDKNKHRRAHTLSRVLDVILSHVPIFVQVFDTKDRGRGVRAAERIVRGTYVCEYAGDLLNREQAEKRELDYLRQGNEDCYMFFFVHNGKHMWYVSPSLFCCAISYCFLLLAFVLVCCMHCDMLAFNAHISN